MCLEFDKALLDSSQDINEAFEIASYAEDSIAGHRPPISAEILKQEADKQNTQIAFVDNQSLKKPKKRQEFIARSIQDASKSYAKEGKGTLVLIGSSHLQNLGEGKTWQALQTLERNYDQQQEKDIGLLSNGTALVSLY